MELKVHKMVFTNTMKDKLKGKYVFHNKDINWSYLSLGKDVLTQINKKIIKQDLINNIIDRLSPIIT